MVAVGNHSSGERARRISSIVKSSAGVGSSPGHETDWAFSILMPSGARCGCVFIMASGLLMRPAYAEETDLTVTSSLRLDGETATEPRGKLRGEALYPVGQQAHGGRAVMLGKIPARTGSGPSHGMADAHHDITPAVARDRHQTVIVAAINRARTVNLRGA